MVQRNKNKAIRSQWGNRGPIIWGAHDAGQLRDVRKAEQKSRDVSRSSLSKIEAKAHTKGCYLPSQLTSDTVKRGKGKKRWGNT